MIFWQMSIYIHLCCSMGDILIVQKILVVWNFDKYLFMLQYGWYFQNSKNYSGMKIWKISIYVHLCCNMGAILMIQKILLGYFLRNVHLYCNMSNILIIQKILMGWKFQKSPFIFIYATIRIGKKISSKIKK